MVQNGKRGRPSEITGEAFMEAVKRARSLNHKEIARHLGKGKSTVWRYINKEENKPIVEKAEQFIISISSEEYTKDLDNMKIFRLQHEIVNWEKILRARPVSQNKINDYVGSFYNVCKAVRKHPNKIVLDDVVELHRNIKEKFYRNEKAPYGLSYLRIREGIRSFFMTMRRHTKEDLNQKGITKEETKGQGKYSKQRVSPKVRGKYMETVKDFVDSYEIYLEVIGVTKVMYYTGTRVSACLEFNFQKDKHVLSKDMWMLEVTDKGEKGGMKWEKYFIGHALDELKDYLSKRFKIEIEDLEEKIAETTDHLFPRFINGGGKTKTSKLRGIVKKALIKAGIPYQKFPALHIWRHTFAQDMLDSTIPPNFEMTAILGGWKTTHRLRKHYGSMSEESKINGLRISMGLPVKATTAELRW